MAPWDMRGAIAKIEANHPLASSPNGLVSSQSIWLTERGSSFGYGNLIVDMTSLVKMREYGYPIVFDATHSVQQPSSQAGITGGNREMVPHLIRAAVAVGIDGLFLEVHPEPEKAISDAANQVRLSDVETILKQALAIEQTIE
jgi:2-dehydro-3-deoxyphosphooctonate aldolase (KDO 8-P synthase)